MLATKLWTARQQGRQVEAAEFTVPADTEAAYAVQAELIREAGVEVAGWKLGATAQATLDLLNLTEPMVGPIFADTVFDTGTEVAIAAAHGPALETEFTVALGNDLPPREAAYGRDDIAIASVHPSFEIIAARYGGIDPADRGRMSIADGGANGGLVIGPAIEDWVARDVTSQQVTVYFDGEEVGGGNFGVLLWDDIYDALVWTANHPKTAPRGLRAGDFVMTGTVAGLIPFQPGVTARADFGPCGTIETLFVAA